MRRLISWLPLVMYLLLVAAYSVPRVSDGPSLPPAPWEELN